MTSTDVLKQDKIKEARSKIVEAVAAELNPKSESLEVDVEAHSLWDVAMKESKPDILVKMPTSNGRNSVNDTLTTSAKAKLNVSHFEEASTWDNICDSLNRWFPLPQILRKPIPLITDVGIIPTLHDQRVEQAFVRSLDNPYDDLCREVADEAVCALKGEVQSRTAAKSTRSLSI